MRRDLPSGTVTFLFTDVEGSTRLLHSLGTEGYAEALAEHRRVIREACVAEGGVEVDTQGDAFFFAFPTAPGALAAAAAMTEALSAGSIQVRIGLHTGSPLVAEEGYVGDDVHFAARVAASGHGGQVVCSAVTAELVEVSLTDLGEHRLKDIAEAVSIFQLGNGSFPPLKTISNTNLPRPASSFVGREVEVEAVLSRIEGGARLVTLTGPGGSGKTRLAIEAAATLVPEYKAGVFWVGLATLRDPAFVTETIAQTLGAKDGLAEHVGERELLLLLDNLEQVIEAAPELSGVLEACPNLTLLVTSRELLRVTGEVEYQVPPLAEPQAVELFCERAQLEPSEEIAELCVRLDNLPLAVELAAARTKALSPAQILERLSQRLDLLKGGRDADPRQQTLRATIEWSYDLLTEAEQQLFARLSVFAGGCTLGAAAEVCEADLDTLQSLVEKSLLRFTDGRYWMLATIREYAGERLTSAGEDVYRARHAGHFTTVVLALNEEVRVGDAWEERLDRLDVERENLRSALSWSQRNGDAEAVLRVAIAVSRLWVFRGPLQEGLRWLEWALTAADTPPALRADALRRVAWMRFRRGEPALGHQAAQESLSLYRDLGDQAGIAGALEDVGEGLSQLGDVAAARECLREARELLSEHGRDNEVGRLLVTMGYLELNQQRYELAAELFQEGLERMRRTERPGEIAYALVNLGSARLALGQLEEAETELRECAVLAWTARDDVLVAYALEALGVATGRLQRHGEAATLLGAAHTLFEKHGVAMQAFELDLHEEMVASLRTSLGSDGFSEAWSRGEALSVDELAAMVSP